MKSVIKIGGSLQDSESLKEVCNKIGDISAHNSLIVVPGGGKFADVVRELQKRFGFSDETAHFMAVRGMEIYGLILNELIPELSLTDRLENAEEGGFIFQPCECLKQNSELERSWKFTSDSIAAWTCGKTNFDTLILVKMVDGIREDGLISQISVQELKEINQAIVDPKLFDILEKSGIICWIINGKHPERIKKVIESENPVGTKITLG